MLVFDIAVVLICALLLYLYRFRIAKRLSMLNMVPISQEEMKKIAEDHKLKEVEEEFTRIDQNWFEEELNIESQKYTITVYDENLKLIISNKVFEYAAYSEVAMLNSVLHLISKSKESIIKVTSENPTVFVALKEDEKVRIIGFTEK